MHYFGLGLGFGLHLHSSTQYDCVTRLKSNHFRFSQTSLAHILKKIHLAFNGFVSCGLTGYSNSRSYQVHLSIMVWKID